MEPQVIRSSTDDTQPEVSVLFSTHNRADALTRTLESLAGQRCDCAWQVVVVDNASTDNTWNVLETFADDERFDLKALYEPTPGKGRALNRALDHIEKGLVFFTDDDVELCDGWVKAYADAVVRWPDHSIFGGPITPVFPAEAPAWVQDNRYVPQSLMFARFAPRQDEGLMDSTPFGANMAIRREAIADHRFDVRFGPGGDRGIMSSETEFETRLARLGYRPFVYVPSAKVVHSVRAEQLTAEAIWQRANRWGRTEAYSDDEIRAGLAVWGAPFRYWLSAALALMKFGVMSLGPERMRVKYGRKWHTRAGRVTGYMEKHEAKMEKD